jgi:hypothetical protein
MWSDSSSAKTDNLGVVSQVQAVPALRKEAYGANNVYNGFPPLMSDGRALVGAWHAEAVEHKLVKESKGFVSNWEYRRYLTVNGSAVMRENREAAYNDTGDGLYLRFAK